MSRVEKAAEPSMEEILASIRKIISEEPASPRPLPQVAAAPPPSAPASRLDPAPVLPNGGLASLAVANGARKTAPSAPAVDDVLDALSNDIPTRPGASLALKPAAVPAPQTPAAPAAPLASSPTAAPPIEAPPWLTQKPQGSVSAGDKRPAIPSPAAPLPPQPSPRDLPRPFFSDPPASPQAAVAQPAAGLQAGSPGTIEPQRRAQVDLGAVVPGRGESLPQAPSLSMPQPGVPTRPGGAREELAIVPHVTIGAAAGANGHHNGSSHQREPTTDTRLSEPQRSPAPASAETTGGRRPDPIPHSRVVAPMSAAAAGLNGSSPGSPPSAARQSEGEAQAPARPTVEAKQPGGAMNGSANGSMNGSATKEGTASPVTDGAAKVPAVPAPSVAALAPTPPAPLGSTATLPSAQPIRTMEDTVAELLRPMLRQWLDANMPRIVEKALRVELAESAKKKH